MLPLFAVCVLQPTTFFVRLFLQSMSAFEPSPADVVADLMPELYPFLPSVFVHSVHVVSILVLTYVPLPVSIVAVSN